MNNIHFPLGLALGEAFCNREAVRERLCENFSEGRHSLLVSPRRYGKTSVVLQSVADCQAMAVKVDFFSVTSLQAAEQKILAGVGELVAKLASKPEQVMRLVKSYFKRFHISLQYKEVGFTVGIIPTEKDTAYSITAALRGLEKIAEKCNKKVVLFFDEMQVVGLLEHSVVIEAAIREAAQESQHVAYVFSGSNRRLLTQLFDDGARPLYLLCQRINLPRILREKYEPHLQKAAQSIWQNSFSPGALSAILRLTECHPYYVNALCSQFTVLDHAPNEDEIYQGWSNYALSEKSRISGELGLLSYNQRKVLVFIAKEGEVTEPTGQYFLNLTGLPSASMGQAIKALDKKDYIEQLPSGAYRLIDPLMKSLLAETVA